MTDGKNVYFSASGDSAYIGCASVGIDADGKVLASTSTASSVAAAAGKVFWIDGTAIWAIAARRGFAHRKNYPLVRSSRRRCSLPVSANELRTVRAFARKNLSASLRRSLGEPRAALRRIVPIASGPEHDWLHGVTVKWTSSADGSSP